MSSSLCLIQAPAACAVYVTLEEGEALGEQAAGMGNLVSRNPGPHLGRRRDRHTTDKQTGDDRTREQIPRLG